MWEGLAGVCEDGAAREKAGGGGGGGGDFEGRKRPKRVEEANVKTLFKAEKSYETILKPVRQRSLVVRSSCCAAFGTTTTTASRFHYQLHLAPSLLGVHVLVNGFLVSVASCRIESKTPAVV